jgi:hypothetical protein
MLTAKEQKIGRLWMVQEARAVLVRHVPELTEKPNLSFIYKNMTLADYAASSHLDPSWLDRVLGELEALPDAGGRDGKQGAPGGAAAYDDPAEAGSAFVCAPERAEQWGVFELELRGPETGNPFIDVALAAEFTFEGGAEPAKRTVKAPGFYDGEGTYRIRFMPDAEGEWRFRTASNARSLDGIEGRFRCVPASAGNHGPVRVKNTYHFAFADGTVYHPIGTTCYAWTHQGEELEEHTLESLKASPFNKMRMCVFPKSYLYNTNEPSVYPFEGSIEHGWDYARFNPAFFRHLERRIADLGRLGIEADLILFHPYDRWGFAEMPADADDRYLRYITARLAAYRNVWWSLANEYDLMWAKDPDDWERFARIVTENDPYGHLLSVHNCLAFYDYGRPWVTHCSIQRIDVYKTSEATTEWREWWRKPIVIDECGYEGDIDQGWGNLTGEELTRRFWEAMVRGGYLGHGETYLNPDEVLWWSKGGRLTGESPARIAFARQFLEEAPNGELNPLPSDWDVPCAGAEDAYRLYYFGFNRPAFREFRMKPGIRWNVSVIDTWNMTIEELPGLYEGAFRIDLPRRPYMAVRMVRSGESV